jgi:nucleotide-binding universal stress UspA family protein
MFKRILIPTDGSPLARRAEKLGITLAQHLGASVVAFHAGSHTMIPYGGGYIAPSSLTPSAIASAARKRGAAYLARIDTAARAGKVPVKSVYVVDERPAEAIVRAARTHRCDAIVMASHSRRGLRRMLLGSVANAVLTHSRIPVVIVR